MALGEACWFLTPLLCSPQSHQRQHNKDKPYKCPNCYRAYSDSASLQIHLSAHAIKHAKAYCCSMCGRAYTSVSAWCPWGSPFLSLGLSFFLRLLRFVLTCPMFQTRKLRPREGKCLLTITVSGRARPSASRFSLWPSWAELSAPWWPLAWWLRRGSLHALEHSRQWTGGLAPCSPEPGRGKGLTPRGKLQPPSWPQGGTVTLPRATVMSQERPEQCQKRSSSKSPVSECEFP